VQAIIVAIDQYAEAALGNRSYFLNKPYGVGGGRSNDVPWSSTPRGYDFRLNGIGALHAWAMRLQDGTLSFGFDCGRELELFDIFAVVFAAPWQWHWDLCCGSGRYFDRPLATEPDCALCRCSVLFFSAGVVAFTLWDFGKPVHVGVVWAVIMAVLSLAAALILIFSKPFAREFAAEREKRPPYKKYLLHAFTFVIVLAAAAATLIDIVNFIQLV
jgi:hypothetical protein